jgi:large subunit ribosomal protein L15
LGPGAPLLARNQQNASARKRDGLFYSTMYIHDLPGDPGSRQKRKRVGRGKGSGHGGRSGRGNKGQKARSGGGKSRNASYECGQLPLARRLPKRGFVNPEKIEYQVVNLWQLNQFGDGETVDSAALRERGLISTIRKPVKLLGEGELERKLVVRVARASSGAAEAISAKGGSVEGTVGKKKTLRAPRRRQEQAQEASAASSAE